MRKENEIYCSNCGTLISLEAKFCKTCGFNQIEFPFASNTDDKLNNEESNSKIVTSIDDNKIELENNKEVIKDNSPNIVGVLLFFLVLSVFYFIETSYSNKSKTSNSTNSGESECTGPGNGNCIDNVRKRFNDVGQTIIGEVHIGNGEFEITFMDRNRPGAYISNITTNCDCVITNVNVSIIR